MGTTMVVPGPMVTGGREDVPSTTVTELGVCTRMVWAGWYASLRCTSVLRASMHDELVIGGAGGAGVVVVGAAVGGGGGDTFMVKDVPATCGVGLLESVTWIATCGVPRLCGTPDMTPLEASSWRPAGRPLGADHV